MRPAPLARAREGAAQLCWAVRAVSEKDSHFMPWLMLAVTILFEVAGSTMMKLANGFTVFWPSVGVVVCYSLSLVGLTIVLKYIDLSVAYAIWSGVGVALIALIGILYFKEPVTTQRIISLALIIIGVVGLQLASGKSA